MSWRMIHGDCVDAMQAMEPVSVDAIVCDPPYGLEFMGKEWDQLGRRIGHHLDPAKEMGRAPTPERGNPWASERPSYGAPKKNARCKACGRLRFDHAGRRCSCEAPDWDTRTAEYAREMQRWHEAWACEALRVLKPGGHLLAFGGTRTYHRLTCAIEDAGFEIRDCIAWMYGSGFPKSLDVGKAIDKAAGIERGATPDTRNGPRTNPLTRGSRQSDYGLGNCTALDEGPATPEAARWDGWGTALKPAFEPIVVARKPLTGTVAQTVLGHGTGALNIDGCRIEGSYAPAGRYPQDVTGGRFVGAPAERASDSPQECNPAGRWPANVVLDPEAAAVLDEQTGECSYNPAGEFGKRGRAGSILGNGQGIAGSVLEEREVFGYGDTGGASRFFYVAKADSAERNAGLAVTTLFTPPDAPTRNDHPTVKPIALMRWLVRLVTPPGGLVLDPFAGSGSTGCAAVLEGFDFVGVEQAEASVRIARARLAHWSNGGSEA